MAEHDKKKEFDEIEDAVFIDIDKEENIEDQKIIKLQKSNSNKLIFGVCGGLGEFFNLNPLIIRAAFMLSTIFTQWIIVLYLLLAVLIPKNSDTNQGNKYYPNIGYFMGILIVSVVLFDFFATQFPIINYLFRIVDKNIIWGIFFVLAGFYLFANANNYISISENINDNKLYKSRLNKKIGGVCSGLADYLGWHPINVRVLWTLLTLFSFGVFLIVYIMSAIIIPYKEGEHLEKV